MLSRTHRPKGEKTQNAADKCRKAAKEKRCVHSKGNQAHNASNFEFDTFLYAVGLLYPNMFRCFGFAVLMTFLMFVFTQNVYRSHVSMHQYNEQGTENRFIKREKVPIGNNFSCLPSLFGVINRGARNISMKKKSNKGPR